jgi:hypothetical protein
MKLVKGTLKTLLVLTLLIAGVTSAANKQTALMTIDLVRASEETDTAYVRPVGDVEIKNTSCSHTDLYAISMSDPNFQTLYATLLSAAAAKQKVRLWISDNSGDCLVSRQRIRVVDVFY